ncbi:MAG TPA: ribosome maturation factor [Balneolaceae bacterium]|nr:ribosome maturation factor [Balneolaceae bacterium]
MQNKVIDKVTELTESVLSATDFFLVDVEIKGSKAPEIWVSVDAEDRGVNMDECAEISNELSFLMEAHELFSGNYRINVSSPGLGRPLKDRRQYPKNVGHKAKIKYKKDGEYLKITGTLQKVTENDISIELDDKSIITIAFDDLVETKIIPSFK